MARRSATRGLPRPGLENKYMALAGQPPQKRDIDDYFIKRNGATGRPLNVFDMM